MARMLWISLLSLCGNVSSSFLYRTSPKYYNSLYESCSFKVLDGLLTELGLNVISPEPLDHINVGGKVPERLNSSPIAQQHFTLTWRAKLSFIIYCVVFTPRCSTGKPGICPLRHHAAFPVWPVHVDLWE